MGAFSGTGYTLSGQTVPATQAPAYAVPTAGQATGPYGFQGQAFVGQQQQPYVPANADEQRLMSTYSLGRAVRILAIMDSVILLINVFVFGPFVVLFAWGPICGYLSTYEEGCVGKKMCLFTTGSHNSVLKLFARICPPAG